jgi:citronellol/citronellal dehydrogenase
VGQGSRAQCKAVGDHVEVDQLPAELFESVEDIVEAVVALCDCPADITGRVFSSLALMDEWGLSVRGLDGLARV